MEKSYFYDSYPDDQRRYQQDDLAAFYSQIIGNGVSNDPNLTNLAVTDTNSMIVQLGPGWAFANGYGYNNTAVLSLTHDGADPTNDRIDRVVIQFDSSTTVRWNKSYIKKGVPATNPVPPSLQRDTQVFELSVAQVRITAGKSFIEQNQITDERANPNVCGYIPLHNIYRALNVSRDGVISMPNQSYVESDSNVPFPIEGGSYVTIPFEGISEDRQNEIDQNTNEFIAKSKGTYMIYCYLRFSEGELPVGVDNQLMYYKNGEYGLVFAAKAISDTKDNIITGSTLVSLNAGDRLSFISFIFGLTGTINTFEIHLRVGKIN